MAAASASTLMGVGGEELKKMFYPLESLKTYSVIGEVSMGLQQLAVMELMGKGCHGCELNGFEKLGLARLVGKVVRFHQRGTH